ncbi:polysaccharide deacetylase [Fontisubflavum oceani]|uniref:polysaccharide deacetylase family protein n=1 Tax=Fontisubflavum oceani TaxID=2978973 RepID=UPI0025B435A9|nr:polysaccharide deacetylase [Fontisubflavum oceani]WJY21114.1 polysaccharide deacetylase [Fontisubflavum oceani]
MRDLSKIPPYQWTEPEWRGLVNRVRAGRRLAPKTWPGNARCAVALSFDCDHETFEMGAGGHAIGRLNWGDYGRRAGVPRILDLLAREAVPASFFMPAVAGLIDPSEPRRIAEAGHEIGVHGWIHEQTGTLSAAEEREMLIRARDTLADLSGTEPVGHRAAHWDLSPHTAALTAELGFQYDSSMMADDECYEILLDGDPSGLIEIPVDWVRDDAAYLLFNRTPPTRPYTSPEAVFDIFRREFDLAYEEGGVCQLVMHPFVIGYRSRIWILDRLIAHAKAKGDVWFTTHRDLAAYLRESFDLSAKSPQTP